MGDGAMQVRTDQHILLLEDVEELLEAGESSFDEDGKRFFKLFQESTKEGSQAAALKMKEIAARQPKHNQIILLFHSLSLLMRADSKKLRWPNSPLRIILQFVDTNMRYGAANVEDPREEMATPTPLHHLSYYGGHSFHKNQVILGQQLFRHGANANLKAQPDGATPLHLACYSSVVTNLDFIQLLLEKGASLNVQDRQGKTPVMSTIPMAPGAAKFLLDWSTPPTTNVDVHIINGAGLTLLDMVHSTIEEFSYKAALPDCPARARNAFLLQQWREIEKMLVERGSH
jgi:hypothetical protein